MRSEKDYCKELLGDRAKQIILDGLRVKEKGKKICCPYHGDKDPSMAWYSQGKMFKCFACNENLDIYRYYMEYEHMSFVDALNKVKGLTGQNTKINSISKKQYVKPKLEMKDLSEEAIKYMMDRKISKETLEQWKVKECVRFGQKTFVFQYFRNDELIYVSYRKVGKAKCSQDKGGCEKDTKAILWGMDAIDREKPVIITEGQPDAMAIHEAGYQNVVSLPAGSNNFTWIDHCWEWLKTCKQLILWKDNDVAGEKCAKELSKRISNLSVIFTEKYKDANEVLFYEGKEAVMRIIKNGLNAMTKGILDVSEMNYTRYSSDETIETGFYEYDEHVEDWKMQELTVIFGRNNEGKSTVISQIIAHCLEKQTKVFLYSGEMSDYKLQNWIYRQIVGNDEKYLDKVYTKYKTKVEIKDEAVKQIKEWHKDNFYLFDLNEEEVAKNLESFFEVMKMSAERYGCKLFIIDNLMSILEEKADSIYNDQANFVQKCKNFARKYNVHVVLVAHPNKIKQEVFNEQGNLSKLDILGSSNIGNKADNIIAIERNWDNTEDKTCDMIFSSLKDRETGQRKTINYNFCMENLRFYNAKTPRKYYYSWNEENKKEQEKDENPVCYEDYLLEEEPF